MDEQSAAGVGMTTLLADRVAAVAAAVAAQSAGLDGRQLAVVLQAVERAQRGLEAAALGLIAGAKRADAFREDGHASVRGWTKATLRIADAEVTHRVRAAGLCERFPQVAAELAAGRVGVGQVRELARVAANPRCGDQLGEAIDPFLIVAQRATFEVFARRVREWEALADADGAHHGHERAHDARRAHAVQVGDEVHLQAQFGAVQGAEAMEIMQRFTDAEFIAEWDDLRARLGDAACAGMMERTDAQRRADALMAIFRRAAGAPPGTAEPEPVLNLLIDQDRYDAQLAAMAADRAAGWGAADAGARGDPTTVQCRAASGVAVDPADAVAASLVGRVRRVVLRPDGLIINLGRRVRVFHGSARDAAVLQASLDVDGRCLWPGCGRRRCQIDHTHPWETGGTTEVGNAGPLCARHNRFKTRGYTTWRDAAGIWHTIRPDGTEIIAA